MKFNKKTDEVSERVTNHMGGLSFKMSPEMELAFASITTFLEDSYYEKADERVERIKKLIKKCEPEFVAKLAMVARTEFNMRSISHLLIAELAKIHRGDSLVKEAIVAAATRVDDLTEIAAAVGNPMPKQIKRGIRNALFKFDRYQLAKYRGEGNKVSLVDLFNLVHPKPEFANREQKKAWKDLMSGNLKSVDTWESKISGSEDEDEKKENWEELVKTGKIGYMALLRNFNNLLKSGVSSKVMKIACKRIADPDEVAKSKQLPFRFLSALKAVADNSKMKFEDEEVSIKDIRKALNDALEASIANIPELSGRTLILTDNSGSMRGDCGGDSLVSVMSHTKSADIANLFSVMYWKRAESTMVGVFGDNLETPKLNREADLYDNFKIIDRVGAGIGGGTEAGIFKMLEDLISEKKKVDRIIIFSDCQVGTGCKWYDRNSHHGDDFNKLYKKYKKEVNPNVITYSIDLKGYGNAMFDDDVFKLTGWSERIFELMERIEKGDGLVDYINSKQLYASSTQTTSAKKKEKAQAKKRPSGKKVSASRGLHKSKTLSVSKGKRNR